MPRRVLLLALALAIVATGCRIPVIARHGPDLVVASIGDPPADGNTVESFALTVSTDNTGVPAANRSVTRVFLSLDDQLGADDAILGEVQVPWLRAVSGPHVASVEATVPASVQPVAYHVLACRGRHEPRQGTERAEQLSSVYWDDLVRAVASAARRRFVAGAHRAGPRGGADQLPDVAGIPHVGALPRSPPAGAIRRSAVGW